MSFVIGSTILGMICDRYLLFDWIETKKNELLNMYLQKFHIIFIRMVGLIKEDKYVYKICLPRYCQLTGHFQFTSDQNLFY